LKPHRFYEHTYPTPKSFSYLSATIATWMRAALNDGASGFVLKAEAESDLLASIKAAFEGEIFSSKVLGL
jgi:hypothetical protein